MVLTQFAPVTRLALSKMAPSATVIRYGVGVDNIDVEAAEELGIRVAYVPDYCVDEVADHTAGLLLALLRKVVFLDRSVREGRWDPVAQAKPMLPLRDATIGLLGCGRIGRAVLARLEPFVGRILIHDPLPSADYQEFRSVTQVDIDTLLRESDALSLHLPLVDATRHVLNGRRLAQMKETAYVVNTARGGLIDTDALAEALRDGRLGGAALDVFEVEPLPEDSPLRSAPNLILTPHAAWYSDNSISRLQRLAAEEAVRALRGEPLRCPFPTS